jgi:hypothetical protein
MLSGQFVPRAMSDPIGCGDMASVVKAVRERVTAVGTLTALLKLKIHRTTASTRASMRSSGTSAPAGRLSAPSWRRALVIMSGHQHNGALRPHAQRRVTASARPRDQALVSAVLRCCFGGHADPSSESFHVLTSEPIMSSGRVMRRQPDKCRPDVQHASEIAFCMKYAKTEKTVLYSGGCHAL